MQTNPDIIRFYFDQNIIDYLIKDKLDNLKAILSKISNAEIVYSYVTLREFTRIATDEQRKPYLDYLKNNNAKYFWIDSNELAHFEYIDPFIQFEQFRSGNPIYNNIEGASLDLLQKLFGGKKDISFEEIAHLQKYSFNDLIEFIIKGITSLEYIQPKDKEYLIQNVQNMNKYFNGLIDQATSNIKNTNSDYEDPLGEIRKLLDLKTVELNNIKGSNIINQIWNMLEGGIKSSKLKITYDDLFGDGLLKHYSSKITMTMKVNALYNLLNILGYHPDGKLFDDNNFIPFINDQRHVGNAIYSNIFITRDRRLMKKAEAVYEHLKIGTKVLLLK